VFLININDKNNHRRFLLEGPHQALADLVACIELQGGSIEISPPQEEDFVPLVVVPNTSDVLPRVNGRPWLVWNRNDLDEIQRTAQENGALCVLSAALSFQSLLNALHTADIVAGARSPSGYRAHSFQRNYEKGEQIHLEEGRVIRVRRGIVRCSAFHPDGSEVLIGFCGEGDVLMAHADYGCSAHDCHVKMRAHSPLSVMVEPWTTAVTCPDFYERLKQRICQMELWSSMQARQSAEDRLLGILQVIGGRFSHKVEQGTMIDIKLTHEQLASAIGATRTTVTRILGCLRKKGVLHMEKTPAGAFFVLASDLDRCHH